MAKKRQNIFDGLKNFQAALLAWYKQDKRDLPFRRSRDPYHIWLSEIMLQQTTMATVLPYYKAFLKKFPNLQSVARAPEEELLKFWQGLGYYSRVRNFQTACRQVLENFDGKIPQRAAELKKLKGIGDYTAAAIASICFDEPVALVDGNVMRVLSRVLEYKKNIALPAAKKFFVQTAQKLLDQKHPGDFNQALMELGALVCRPKSTLCPSCPVQKHCLSFGKNPESLPRKEKPRFISVDYHALLIAKNNKVLLKKPAADNLIANMWELPTHHDLTTPPENSWQKYFKKLPKLTRVGSVRHSITNKKITTHVYRIPAPNLISQGHEFVPLARFEQIPLSTLSRKIVKKFFSPESF